MSIRLTVSTRNSRATIANVFAKADARVQRDARKLTAKYGEKTHKLARELAPVKSGFLRGRIILRFSEDGFVYEVGWRAADFEETGKYPYFFITEFGGRTQPANPCVFPARDRIAPAYQRDLRATLRRAWARRGAA